MPVLDHGTYVGSQEHLKGKGALIRPAPNSSMLLAQFDDIDLVQAYGWHAFPTTDFKVDVKEPAE